MSNLHDKKVIDENTRHYIKHITVIQAIFLVLFCLALLFFTSTMLSKSQENLKAVALDEVREAMEETIDNLVIHIDLERERIYQEGESYLEELAERFALGVLAVSDTSLWGKGAFSNLVQVIHTDAAGNIQYISEQGQVSKKLTPEEKQLYLREDALRLAKETDKGEVVFFLLIKDIDELVQADIYQHIHAEVYKGNQYIWVNEVINLEGGDDYAIRKIHPNLVDSEGQYLSTDMQDSVGNYPYLVELEGIREKGYVFHSYYFKNKLDDNVIEKFSYAVYYEPFHWIIATGETLEEMYKYSTEISNENTKRTLVSLAIFIALFILFFVIMVRILIHQSAQYREEMRIQADVLQDIYTTMSIGLIRIRLEKNKINLIKINPKALELFGVESEAELRERKPPLVDGVSNEPCTSLAEICENLKEKWDSVTIEGYVLWKDGSKHLLHICNTLIEVEGDAKVIQHTCQDITEERKQHEEALLQAEEKATLDPMTQIKNKRGIERIIRDQIKEAAAKKQSIAIGFVDIDNFRNYNTNYGHLQGDEVIKYVANVLQEGINGNVGRTGGDEFAFCILGASKEDIERQMQLILEKLNIGIPIMKTGEIIPTPCSIGVVIEKEATMNYETLVRYSDEAMYQAKENGKNTYFIMEK